MRKENEAFIQFENDNYGIIFNDENHKEYPIKYYNLINGLGCVFENNKSYFGYVYGGIFVFPDSKGYNVTLSNGMFFSFHGKIKPELWASGKVIIIEVQNEKGNYKNNNYTAYRIFGGAIEEKGRLKYIDGCTDSLLISPVKKGDPCLNHLHFPDSIDQTQHTHPSHRIGIVASGRGECITPFGNLPLETGMIFVIKEWDGKTFSIGLDGNSYPNGQHAFKTFDTVMNVIAFHPDSDFGAEDEFHPMINRTIVGGVSANKLKNIMTK